MRRNAAASTTACPGNSASRPARMTSSSSDEGDALAAGHAHEARQARRHLHDGDAVGQPLLGRREPQGQVEAQRRQHREGPGRCRWPAASAPAGHRRGSTPPAPRGGPSSRSAGAAMRIPFDASAGSSSAVTRAYSLATSAWTRADTCRSCWAGVRPDGSGSVSPSSIAFLQPRHADHEELVEVRRHDRRELHALEQRVRRVGRLFQRPAR